MHRQLIQTFFHFNLKSSHKLKSKWYTIQEIGPSVYKSSSITWDPGISVAVIKKLIKRKFTEILSFRFVTF